jgi:hypothetical protein
VIAAILLFAGPALATPPDSIAVSLDSTHLLSVDVHHPVKKWPSEHFIIRITVALNDKTVITQTFGSQTSQEWQSVWYQVNDAKPGDKIAVTAECSVLGKLTVNYVVPPL